MRFGVTGQNHLTGELDDTLVQRSPGRTAKRRKTPARKCVGGRSESGIDVVADGAGRIGENPRKVEPIADTKRGTGFVRVLGKQLIPAALRYPVQLGANVQQRQVRRRQ